MAAKKLSKKKTPVKVDRSTAHVRFPCIAFQQGGHEMVMFSCAAKKLWSLVEINRREEQKDDGYQRALSPARVQDLRQFIDANNLLPTGVVISFDEARIEGSNLVVPNKQSAGWVIDGQHRLAGAHEAGREIAMPVIAFLKLSLKDQVNVFVTINREQKGVPTSLYYELLPHLPGDRTEADAVKLRAKDLAKALASDEESPFYGKIVSTTAPRRGQLSLTNFIRKLQGHLKLNIGVLAQFRDDDRAKIINNYYLALAAVFPKAFKDDEESIFFKTLGFGALMNALPRFMYFATYYYKGLRVAEFTKVLKLVDNFRFDEWHGRGTGSAAENTASQDLIAALERAFSQQQDAPKKLLL
ncbi:MAG TPA: DGQHR domain-containing protein [Polyangiaceae bacterium]